MDQKRPRASPGIALMTMQRESEVARGDREGSGSRPVSRRRSLREEQKELTRRRLTTAARNVFEDRGYTDAAIGDITDVAGVNRATFYLHFNNKSEVFTAVMNELFAGTAEYWRAMDRALMRSSRSAIRDWLDETSAWYINNARLLGAWNEAVAVDVTVSAATQAYMDTLAEELRDYLSPFEPAERDDARLRVILLIEQLTQVYYRFWVQGVLRTDREHLLDVLTDIWCSSLHLDVDGRSKKSRSAPPRRSAQATRATGTKDTARRRKPAPRTGT